MPGNGGRDRPVLRRRTFLGQGALASAWYLVGCGDASGGPVRMGPDGGPPDEACDDPFAGGRWLGDAPFVDENAVPLDTVLNQGWDGRLYTDLSRLEPDALIISNDLHYIRTLYPDRLVPPDVWTITVDGLVDDPAELALPDLMPLQRDMGVHVLECSGNARGGAFGLMSAARWGGIPVTDVLDRIRIRPEATRVLVSGFDDHSVPSVGMHSTPGASWIFTFDELVDAGAFFATRMNDAPLPPDHGEPVRLFVPGWYGCACIKWVNRIAFVDESAESTPQMREFASRTHQDGVPTLARDFIPATLDQAAMPVRVERWRVDGQILYRVVGILWGGSRPADALTLRLDGAEEPVMVCPPQTTNATWTLWTHPWVPGRTGDFVLSCAIDDPSIRTRRLDDGYYARVVRIDEV